MRKKSKTSRMFAALIFLLIALSVPMFAQANFEPDPKTPYASSFVHKCEGQTWFMDEVERLLNQEQKTINRLSGVDDLSRIRSIGLRDKGIEGKIPAAIGELKSLRYLFLSGNRLSGTIPSELYSLPLLENVDLSGNLFDGSIPSGFGNMTSLSVLMLKDNQYTGTIPNSILENANITVLDLTRNKLSGGIPSAITGMVSLKYLSLSENSLGGTIPDLSSLKQLTTLSLQNCGLTGSIPESIYQLTELAILDLGGNNLEGEISPSLDSLAKLRCLILSQNKLRGVVPDAFHITATDENNAAEIRLDQNYLRGMVPNTLETAAAAGAVVRLNDNYMNGEALRALESNENNFADGATSSQYQLASANSTIRLSTAQSNNVYTLLKNERPDKELLRPSEYSLVYDQNKIFAETKDNGIFLRALTELPLSEKTVVSIQIKGNDNSKRSKIDFIVTTEPLSIGGGGGGGSSSRNYTITVDDANAVNLSKLSASPNELITVSVNADEGIIVTDGQGARIALEKTGNQMYTFRMPNSDVHVVLASPPVHDALTCSKDTACPISSFTDAKATEWYHDGVHFCVENGYMKGTGASRFEPEAPTTRATIITILYRMEGSPAVLSRTSYSDVAADSWYSDAVEWADEYGIAKGYGNGTFGPGDPITREQFATILFRYAAYKEYDLITPSDMKAYTDIAQISPWAMDGVKWANTIGLLQGRTETTLAPAAISTRAEAATLIFRFCKNVAK